MLLGDRRTKLLSRLATKLIKLLVINLYTYYIIITFNHILIQKTVCYILKLRVVTKAKALLLSQRQHLRYRLTPTRRPRHYTPLP